MRGMYVFDEHKVAIAGNSLKKRKKGARTDTRVYQLYALCIIPIALVIIFNYLPMVGIIIAFKNYKFNKGIFGSDWVGLDNFKFFFESNEFLRITWNTLYINFLYIVFGLIAAVTLALLLFELHNRTAVKTFQTIMITPNFLSWVVVSYMSYAILNPQFGFLNLILEKFGMSRVDWYSIPQAWPAILTIVHIWKSMGMSSIIYYASLMGVDDSIIEAAEVDGANKFQRIWYISLPMLIPIITIMTIMNIGNIFRADFGMFYQVTRDVGALYSTTDVIDTYIFRTMRVVGNMSMSSAVGLLQSVVGFVLVVLTNSLSKKIDGASGLF